MFARSRPAASLIRCNSASSWASSAATSSCARVNSTRADCRSPAFPRQSVLALAQPFLALRPGVGALPPLALLQDFLVRPGHGGLQGGDVPGNRCQGRPDRQHHDADQQRRGRPRRPHFTHRSMGPARRPRMGSPARNRPRSSASRAAAGITPCRILVQALQAIVSRSRGALGVQLRGGTGSASITCSMRVVGRRRLERRPAGQAFVEDRPQANTRRRRGQSSFLPCACSGAMYDGVPMTAPVWAFPGPPPPRLARPKSRDLAAGPSAIQQHVVRLQVAVDDALLVGGLHRPGTCSTTSAASSAAAACR